VSPLDLEEHDPRKKKEGNITTLYNKAKKTKSDCFTTKQQPPPNDPHYPLPQFLNIFFKVNHFLVAIFMNNFLCMMMS
jgi:hypothetical protein